MAELLIHSMSEFAELILDGFDIVGACNIAEIGAEFGGMSQHLADYAAEKGGHFTSIDPAPQPEFMAWLAANHRVTHIPALSIGAIPQLSDVDVWVIDGDHNWYTVYNELKAIHGVCCRDGKPFLAFLHDVAWPWGRRDLYYAPGTIPEAFRHAHDYDGGTILGQPGLTPNRGFRGGGAFAAARHEGGPCNGVLTAIEDFHADCRQRGEDLVYAHVPAVFGLGVLFSAAAPWAGELAQSLMPYHQNKLLKTLEENRLRNYLAVLDWQDRTAEAA